MKHLHYANLVVAISDQLAGVIQEAAHLFMTEGKSSVWPVAGYRDEREEISVQLAFGPGIAFGITDPYLSDDRPPAQYDEDSIAYIDAERGSLENDLRGETPENVVVYGRFEKDRNGGGWSFSGLDGIEQADNVAQAVQLMNESGYAVVAATESGAPGGDLAWSNVYLIGRWI